MNPKQESERLMNAAFPLAEKMLRDYGEFYPYGAYLRPDGEIVDVGARDPDTQYPKSKDLLYVLRSSFQEMAHTNRCKAVAIVFNIAVNLPESSGKSNAIQVCLDHIGGYSAEVLFPYQIVDGEVAYGETFAQEGKHEIFAGR